MCTSTNKVLKNLDFSVKESCALNGDQSKIFPFDKHEIKVPVSKNFRKYSCECIARELPAKAVT